MWRLGIFDLFLHCADIVRDMAVRCKDVRQSVEIIIKEETAEGKREQRRLAYRRSWSFVDEQACAFVMIERHHFVREVADHNALPARAIIVSGVDSHSRSGDSGLAESYAGRHRVVGEGPIAVVVIKLIRLSV